MAQDAWAKEDFAECFADFRVELCLCRLLRPSTFSVVVVVVVACAVGSGGGGGGCRPPTFRAVLGQRVVGCSVCLVMPLGSMCPGYPDSIRSRS